MLFRSAKTLNTEGICLPSPVLWYRRPPKWKTVKSFLVPKVFPVSSSTSCLLVPLFRGDLVWHLKRFVMFGAAFGVLFAAFCDLRVAFVEIDSVS